MKYFAQETYYSCGASALRNVFNDFGIKISEEELRKELGTDVERGTDEFSILCVAEDYDFKCKEVKSISTDVIKRKIIKDLKNGYKLVMAVDNFAHWIAVLDYSKRKIKIIDSRYKEDLGQNIMQEITLKALINRSLNFDLETNKNKYYYIALKLEDENI